MAGATMELNRTSLFAGVMLAAAALFMPAGASGADAPATQPARGMPGLEAIINRTGRVVDQVSSLTADQKKQIDDILSNARKQADQMGQDLAGLDPRARAGQLRDFLGGMRRDIGNVLTPQQREQIQRKLGGGRALAATTRPGSAAGRQGEYFQRFVERMHVALDKLDLTAEQKSRIKSLFADVKTKADQIRAQMKDDAAGARDKARDLLRGTRQGLMEILTPDQQEKLRDEMRANERNNRGGGAQANNPRQAGADNRADQDRTPPVDQAMAPIQGPSAGDAAPAISLPTLDGHRLTTSALKGRVAVIIFGSYSSPSFRLRAADIEKLSSDYGIRAHIYVVYTREAHASGQWEVDRNKDADIQVEQPSTSQKREDLARSTRTRLKLTVPIALDTMDNSAAEAFGAGENSAYLIGRDGTILMRQQWFDPYTLRRRMDQAVAAVNPSARPVPPPVVAQ